MAYFNGAYSVRGSRYKSSSALSSSSSGLLTCPNGHIYKEFMLVDNRKNGGCCFKKRVTECPKCKAEEQGNV
jgi:hypothetical protein